MKSGKPKVLHQVANRSMLGHVLAALTAAGATRLAVVVGPDREDVAKEVAESSAGGCDLRAERSGSARLMRF